MVVIEGSESLQNRPMPTDQEKAGFAERLRAALNNGPDKVKGPTDLARLFNLRHRSSPPVSVQTVEKWLKARAIPKADKIETLADWLGVTAHWLHYGPEPTLPAVKTRKDGQRKEIKYPVSAESLTLAEKIRALSPRKRYLIEELVSQLYRESDDS